MLKCVYIFWASLYNESLYENSGISEREEIPWLLDRSLKKKRIQSSNISVHVHGGECSVHGFLNCDTM
jgi:hypothetical protein